MRLQGIGTARDWPQDAVLKQGILVLAGYGLDIRVWRGRLRVEDGFGRKRRSLLVHRATGGLRRLVVLGHTGSISLDAIRWLDDVGAGYTQIDADGKLLATFGGGDGYEQPRLRRAQARALGEPEGLALARRLIEQKLTAQARTAASLDGHVPSVSRAIADIQAAVDAVASAEDAGQMRLIESAGALAYWSAWSPLALRFVDRDHDRVPPHWLTFGSRKSAVTGQPRSATNPANAMLNYLYAIVESEASIAAQVVGLDPGLGVFHVDARYRASLASDLMEPVRPLVDRYLVDTIVGRTFGARDFFETRTGVCRITPPLAKELAATMLHWRPLVGKVAEDVAHALLEPPDWEPLTRPITRPQRGGTTRRPSGRADGRTDLPPIERRCAECGNPVRRRQDRTCSAECENLSRIKHGHAAAAKGRETMRRLRAEGRDPTKSPEAIAKRAQSAAKRRAEQRAWDALHRERPDPDFYRREIQPHLADVSIYRIIQATGLSTAQAWRIRSGRVVPHPRWWEALRDIT